MPNPTKNKGAVSPIADVVLELLAAKTVYSQQQLLQAWCALCDQSTPRQMALTIGRLWPGVPRCRVSVSSTTLMGVLAQSRSGTEKMLEFARSASLFSAQQNSSPADARMMQSMYVGACVKSLPPGTAALVLRSSMRIAKSPYFSSCVASELIRHPVPAASMLGSVLAQAIDTMMPQARLALMARDFATTDATLDTLSLRLEPYVRGLWGVSPPSPPSPVPFWAAPDPDDIPRNQQRCVDALLALAARSHSSWRDIWIWSDGPSNEMICASFLSAVLDDSPSSDRLMRTLGPLFHVDTIVRGLHGFSTSLVALEQDNPSPQRLSMLDKALGLLPLDRAADFAHVPIIKDRPIAQAAQMAHTLANQVAPTKRRPTVRM